MFHNKEGAGAASRAGRPGGGVFAKQFLLHPVLYRPHTEWNGLELEESQRARREAARRQVARALSVSPRDMPRLEEEFLNEYITKMRRLVHESLTAGCGDAEALARAPSWMRRAEEKLHRLPGILREFHAKTTGLSCRAGLLAADGRPAHLLEKLVEGLQQLGGPGETSAFCTLAQRWNCSQESLSALWECARELSMGKVLLQATRGDRPLPPWDELYVARADWRVADLAIMHDHSINLLTEESFSMYQQLEALTMLFQAAQSCSLEERGSLEDWARALHIFQLRGSSISLVVLQRRWYELKASTRTLLMAAWRATPAPDPAHQPRPIHVAIARRFPHVLCKPLPTWRALVAAGRVHQGDPEALCSLASAAVDADAPADVAATAAAPALPPAPPPPPPPPAPPPPPRRDMDEDLIIVEKDIETIDVDEPAVARTVGGGGGPLVAVKQESTDLRQELRVQRLELCGQLQQEMDYTEAQMRQQDDLSPAAIDESIPGGEHRNDAGASTSKSQGITTSREIIDADASDSDVEIIPVDVFVRAKGTQGNIDTVEHGSLQQLKTFENQMENVNSLNSANLNIQNSERNVNLPHLDTGQTCLLALEKLDPKKVTSSMLILESDEDDDSNGFPQSDGGCDGAHAIDDSNTYERATNYLSIENEHSYASSIVNSEETTTNSLQLQNNIIVSGGNLVIDLSWMNKVPSSEAVAVVGASEVEPIDTVNEKTGPADQVDEEVAHDGLKYNDIIVDNSRENTISDNIYNSREIKPKEQKVTDLAKPRENLIEIRTENLTLELTPYNIDHSITLPILNSESIYLDSENQPQKVTSTTDQIYPMSVTEHIYSSSELSNSDKCLGNKNITKSKDHIELIPKSIVDKTLQNCVKDTEMQSLENNSKTDKAEEHESSKNEHIQTNVEIESNDKIVTAHIETRCVPKYIEYSERENLLKNSDVTKNNGNESKGNNVSIPISPKKDEEDYQIGKNKSEYSQIEQIEPITMSNNICDNEENKLDNDIENDVEVVKLKLDTKEPNLSTNDIFATEDNDLDLNKLTVQNKPFIDMDYITDKQVEGHSKEIEKILTTELSSNTHDKSNSGARMSEQTKPGDQNIESDVNTNELVKPDAEMKLALSQSNKKVIQMDISEPNIVVVASNTTDSIEPVIGVTKQTKRDLTELCEGNIVLGPTVIDTSELLGGAIEPDKINFSEFNVNTVKSSDSRIKPIFEDIRSNDRSELNGKMDMTEYDLSDPTEPKLVIDEDFPNVDTVELGATSYSVVDQSELKLTIIKSVDDHQPDNGSESDELECSEEPSGIDPKLLLPPLVTVRDLSASPFWRKYSRGGAVDVCRVDLRQFLDPEPDYTQIQVSGKNLSNQEYKLTYYIRDLSKNPDFDIRLKELSAGFLSVGSNMDLMRRCTPVTVDLERLAAERAQQPSTGERCWYRGSARKPVELPDIEEVRRVNRSLLTAEVAPLAPGPSPAHHRESEKGSSDEKCPLTRHPGRDPGEAAADGRMPTLGQLKELIHTLMTQPPPAKPDLVPGIRIAGQAVGPAAHARSYCCGARKHRAVNDARRRNSARAGRPPPAEIQIHSHPAGESCGCCCPHLLLQEQDERRRLKRLHRALQRQLHTLLGAEERVAARSHKIHSSHKKSQLQPATATASATVSATASGTVSATVSATASATVSASTAGREEPKKKKPKSKKKDEQSDVAASVELADGYQEWIRQKNLTTKYFHISPAAPGRAPATSAPPTMRPRESTSASGLTIVKLCHQPSPAPTPPPPPPPEPLATVTVELPALMPPPPAGSRSLDQMTLRVAPPQQATNSVSNLPQQTDSRPAETSATSPPRHQHAAEYALVGSQPDIVRVIHEHFSSNPSDAAPADSGQAAAPPAHLLHHPDRAAGEEMRVLPLTELNVIQHTWMYEEEASRPPAPAAGAGAQLTDSMVLPLTRENVTTHTTLHEDSQRQNTAPSSEQRAESSAGSTGSGGLQVEDSAELTSPSPPPPPAAPLLSVLLSAAPLPAAPLPAAPLPAGDTFTLIDIGSETAAAGDKLYRLVDNGGVLTLQEEPPAGALGIAISNVVSLAPRSQSTAGGVPPHLEVSKVESLADSVLHNRHNNMTSSSTVLSPTPIVLPSTSTALRLGSTLTPINSTVIPTNTNVLPLQSTAARPTSCRARRGRKRSTAPVSVASTPRPLPALGVPSPNKSPPSRGVYVLQVPHAQAPPGPQKSSPRTGLGNKRSGAPPAAPPGHPGCDELSTAPPVRVSRFLHQRDPAEITLLCVDAAAPLLRLAGDYLVVTPVDVPVRLPTYWTMMPLNQSQRILFVDDGEDEPAAPGPAKRARLAGAAGAAQPASSLLQVKAFAKQPPQVGNALSVASEASAASGASALQLCAPDRVFTDNRLYKKLWINKITGMPVYAQVLTAVCELGACRELLAGAAPVLMYSLATGRATAVVRDPATGPDGRELVGLRCEQATEGLKDLVIRFSSLSPVRRPAAGAGVSAGGLGAGGEGGVISLDSDDDM